MTIQVSKQGEFKSGWKKNRPGQEKKLAKQMTTEEINYLAYSIKEINRIVLHPHLQWKSDTGQLSFDIVTIQKMLKNKNIKRYIKEFSYITLNDGRIDHRVLIRSSRTELVNIDGRGLTKCNLMFVVSLDTNEIITAYYVHIHNRFDSPNMERYNEKLDIIGILRKPNREIKPVKKERPALDDLSLDEWLDVFEKDA